MIRLGIGAAAAGLVMLAAGVAHSGDAYVSGTATYRELVTLPPDATLEVVLQDVSRADAPAIEVGRVETTGLGDPPYTFRVAYERSAIDDRRVYAVRAAVYVDGRLAFTTDRSHPVITGGSPEFVDVTLVGVGDEATPAVRPFRVGSVDGTQRPRARAPTASAGDGGDGGGAEAAPPLRGFVTFAAEAASFTDCATGRDYPIAEEGDYTALEHAYVAAGREPGGPVMASFDGEIVERPGGNGGAAQPTVHVQRFVGIWPDETCEPAKGNRPLVETRWRIARLRETEIAAEAGAAEPYLVLQAGEGQRFAASVGCNMLVGGFEMERRRLAFGPVAATLMACPPPLDVQERMLGGVLGDVRGWKIDGERLELLDDAGAVIAELEATTPA